MATATETKGFAAYSPTSTPILDVLRPPPNGRLTKVTAGEYFFLSSLLIVIFTALPGSPDALRSLSSASGGLTPVLVVTPAAAFALALLVHQAGHAIAASLGSFKVVSLVLFRNSGPRGAGQRLHAYEPLRLGVLLLDPRRMQHLPRRLAMLYLGGPLAGLLAAAALELGRDWSHATLIVRYQMHLLAAFNVLVSLASLLPDTTRTGSFSDGARLLMLLKNDAAAERLFSILQMQRAIQKGMHPRKWDPELVVRATAVDDETKDAVAGRWLAYFWASERQDITSATKYLEDALAAPSACSAGLRDRLFLEAAVFQAWFRDNPAKARSWAALIDEQKLAGFERQRLKIAMLWADGKLFDAFEKLADYSRSLRELPQSPARELAENSAVEWKHQMESRMLTRAWRSMYTMSQQVDSLSAATTLSAGSGR